MSANKPAGLPSYGLINSQEMVRYMWKYSLHMQATQIPCAVAFGEPLDFSVLESALNAEIERNDCLRLRFYKEKGEIRQYVLPRFRPERIPVKRFSSDEALRAYFDAAAGKPLDVFGGQTFDARFFETANGRSGVFLNVSHMVMDAMATFTFFRDLTAVYDAMKTASPMPPPLTSYESLIRRELEDPEWEAHVRRETDTVFDWFRSDRPPTYCSLRPNAGRPRLPRGKHSPGPISPKDFFPLLDKTHFSRFTLPADVSGEIADFTERNEISAEWVIQLGLRAVLEKLNRTDDTVFWVLCPRRRTVKEKRAGGTLASPMPWRERLPGTLTFREGLAQLAKTQGFLFRHADVPFTALRERERALFGYNPLQTSMSMMFSYLPLGNDAFGGRDYEYMGFHMGRYVMPLYTVALYDAHSGCYRFNYIHRIRSYTDGDVLAFHNRAVKTILAGVRAPDQTLNTLTEEEYYAERDH